VDISRPTTIFVSGKTQLAAFQSLRLPPARETQFIYIHHKAAAIGLHAPSPGRVFHPAQTGCSPIPHVPTQLCRAAPLSLMHPCREQLGLGTSGWHTKSS
jgi:hypothetical protein